jgi:hypothetical protein
VIGKGVAVDAKLTSLARGQETGLALGECADSLPGNLVTHLPDDTRQNCDQVSRGHRRPERQREQCGVGRRLVRHERRFV